MADVWSAKARIHLIVLAGFTLMASVSNSVIKTLVFQFQIMVKWITYELLFGKRHLTHGLCVARL